MAKPDAAMEAARELFTLIRGLFLPPEQHEAGRQEIAAIIRRHYAEERREVRDVLIKVARRGCVCGSTTRDNWHSEKCPIPRAEALLRKMEYEYAALEFMRPLHPEAHFGPTDSRESPGSHRVGELDPSQRHEREI